MLEEECKPSCEMGGRKTHSGDFEEFSLDRVAIPVEV